MPRKGIPMHEMALAQNIVDTIGTKVDPDLEKLAAIHIEMGAFSGVVADSLDFCLKTILSEKNNGHVTVNITEIPTIALCECGTRYSLTDIFESCDQCQSFTRELVSGMDVMIKSVEMVED